MFRKNIILLPVYIETVLCEEIFFQFTKQSFSKNVFNYDQILMKWKHPLK